MSKKSKTSTTPWNPTGVNNAVNTIQNTVTAQQPNLQRISDGISAQLPGLGARAFGAQPGVDAATSYNQSVFGGKYLDQGNPYMQGMLNNTNQLVGNAVNQNFSMAGRSGSGNHEYALANGLANADNSLQYQNYGQERNAQATAAGQMPSLAAGQYAGVMPYLGAAGAAAETPFTGLNNEAQIGGILSPYNNTTQKMGTGTFLGGLLGAGLSGWASGGFKGFSDPALKKDVTEVGKMHDGLPVVDFTYRQDKGLNLPMGRQRGVMADDVAKMRPWALGPKTSGYMTVNYGAL